MGAPLMTTRPGPTLESFPSIVFRFASGHLELLNRDLKEYPEVSLAAWREIVSGGWRELVPEEVHPEGAKLGGLPESGGYVTVEFPVCWMGNTLWARVLAAAVRDEDDERKVVGVAQDVTHFRQFPFASEELSAQDLSGAAEDSRRVFCHDLSGPLTSIIVNCELLLESERLPEARHRLETILSEAFRIDRVLRDFPGT